MTQSLQLVVAVVTKKWPCLKRTDLTDCNRLGMQKGKGLTDCNRLGMQQGKGLTDCNRLGMQQRKGPTAECQLTHQEAKTLTYGQYPHITPRNKKI